MRGNPVNLTDFWGLYESPWYLQWVPGQHLFDAAVTALENGNYGSAAIFFAGMGSEQVLFVLTLGGGASVKISSQCAASKNVLENANFAQKTFSETFSNAGKFAGQTIDDIVAALRSGSLKPSDLQIDYIVREGNTLILNTRSAQALMRAGIPPSEWTAINSNRAISI